MTTNYPSAIDTDLELERVDDNVTEIGGDAINSIRDAVFAIEKAIGASPQGNASTLAARINVSIDADGNLRQSALSSRGLVTLPITNSQVGTNAAIAESKLDLDYSTQVLKNLTSSNRTDIDSLTTSVLNLTYRLTRHTSGNAEQHDGYHILINQPTATQYGIAGLSGSTIGAAVNELAEILLTGDGTTIPHIEGDLASGMQHRASRVSVDGSNFTNISPLVDDVQEALEDIDSVSALAQVRHTDDYHSNGIYRDINSGTYYNENDQKILNGTISYTEGSSTVTFSGLSDSVYNLGVRSGDILYIASSASSTQYGTFQVRAVGPLVDSETLGGLTTLTSSQVAVFNTFSATESSITASVYGPASVSGENATLACAIKRNNVVIDTVSIMDPGAARVVSLGFNGAILSAPESGDGYTLGVEVGFGNGVYRAIEIPRLDLEKDGVSTADPVSADSVSQRINAYVADVNNGVSTDGVTRHFPITAFRIGNELAIAHNLVGSDYTLEILDGYTGNYALGFDDYGAAITGEKVKGNITDAFSINGNSLEGLATVVSGVVSETSVLSRFGTYRPLTTFAVKNSSGTVLDLVELGVVAGDVIHVTGHPEYDVNGSYLIESVSSSNVTIYTNEAISVPGGSVSFNVLITHSHISLSSLTSAIDNSKGLMQIYVDEDGKTWAHQRLLYGTGMGAGIEIVDVNSAFPVSSVTVAITNATDSTYNFNLLYGSLSGKSVEVPQNFEGAFKLYHPNGIDYFTIKVLPGTVVGPTAAPVSVTVSDPLNSDEVLELCMLHFDGVEDLTNIVDQRWFGTTGVKQLRDDFIESYYRQPWAELRSNGVARGFDLTNVVYNDSLTGMQALPVNGGVAYIDGIRVEVETQKVVLPSYSSGVLIASEVYVVGINEHGTVRAFTDELGEMLEDGYKSSAAFGRVLPLYEVTLTNGLIDTVVDVRKFINDLDEKVNLIVDETNNIVGSFRTLEGALRYANNYPSRERLVVQIVNEVTPSGAVTVPEGVSLIGNAPYGGGVHRIKNTSSGLAEFITFEGNNRVSNLAIVSDDVDMDGSLVYINGPNVVVDHCLVSFEDTDSMSGHTGNYAIELGSAADGYVEVVNNRIVNAFCGVISNYGCDHLQIRGNYIADITDGGAAASYAIGIGTSARSVAWMDIVGNRVNIPSVGSGDIQGINVDIGETIALMRIQDNALIHEYGDSVSAGIYIDNSAASTNVIEELFISGNLIRGVSLNSANTYGIRVDYTENVHILGNILKDIGVAELPTNNIIYFAGNYSDNIEISNNIMQDGKNGRAIYCLGAANTTINNNILKDLKDGGAGDYIKVDSATGYITICGNVLDDSNPKDDIFGINVGGNSIVSNNVINNFEGAAIVTISSVVIGNYISMKDQADGSGIRIGASSLVSNNFINSIELIGQAIIILSDSTSCFGNYIKNTTDSSTKGISISGSRSDVTISGNVFEGDFTNIIYGTTVDTTSIINNSAYSTTIDPSGYAINVSTATNIVLDGNVFPDSSYTLGSSVTNLIGINRGLTDTRGLSLAEGVASFAGEFTQQLPHWYLDGYSASSDDAWVANHVYDTVPGNRRMFFPISHLPNGCRLESVTVYGSKGSTQIDITVKRRDVTPGSTSTIGTTHTVSSGSGTFTETVDIDGAQEIDCGSYSYYILIESYTGALVTAQKIYGVTLSIRY
jgi:hypothetical protein